MESTPSTTRYLDPAALTRLKHLGLTARLVVEGLFAGRHRSPRKGFSIEFAEHRQYTPGVDPRHLDWKILGKRDRLYVKQYEETTNLRAWILLDASASMGYRHTGPMSKLEYACYCAASLAHLMQTQHDAVGMITCQNGSRSHIPPRQGRGHLSNILQRLDLVAAEGQADLADSLHHAARMMKRRALLIVLSDLFSEGPAQRVVDALAHVRHHKHEVLVLHILDRAELEFPFTDATQIEDIETHRLISADAQAIRDHYLQRLDEHMATLRLGCSSHGVAYTQTDTSRPFDQFLGAYLSQRQHQYVR